MKSADRGILSEHDLKKTGNKIVYGIMVFFILLMIFSMLYPILMTMFNGLKSNVEVNSFPPHFSRRSGISATLRMRWIISICRCSCGTRCTSLSGTW